MEELIPLENGSNISDSICYKDIDYCVESTIYRKVFGTIIFVVVWPFIVLDFKKFPLSRPAAALIGAALMVLFVVVPQKQVYIILGEKGNLQTLYLLIGMMLLSYYYDRAGMLKFLSRHIFGKDEPKPFHHVLWKVCVLSAVLSAIITNDATCVVLTPLLLKKHRDQGRSKKEYAPLLLGIATSANIGSASTFFGNPQNAFIAANSDGQVSLLIFFMTTLPAAVIGTAISIAILYLCYFRTFRHKRVVTVSTGLDLGPGDQPVDGVATNTEADESIAESCRILALSRDQSTNPLATSSTAAEYNKLHGAMQDDVDNSIAPISRTPSSYGATVPDLPSVFSRSVQVGDSLRAIPTTVENEMKGRWPAKWKKRIFVTWLIVVTVMVIVLLAIPPLPAVEFNLGLVPVGAAAATMLVDTLVNRKYAYDAMKSVDWTLIIMFMGLFVWLAGVQNTLFPKSALDLVRMHMDLNTVQGVLFFTAFVAVGSNIFSNVPLVILIVEQLSLFRCGDGTCTNQLTGVLLAWVSTIAGNFTLIGSIANIIVAEQARNATASKDDITGKARNDGYRLSFLVYLKFGFCSTLVVLLAGLPIVYFVGDNVHIKF